MVIRFSRYLFEDFNEEVVEAIFLCSIMPVDYEFYAFAGVQLAVERDHIDEATILPRRTGTVLVVWREEESKLGWCWTAGYFVVLVSSIFAKDTTCYVSTR